MCTHPDRQSIPATLSAFRESFVAVFVSLGTLLVAAATLPPRLVARRRSAHAAPARLADVDVQIHLEDPACVRDLRRVIRQTLRRAARTWTPLPLPVDRVVVGFAFPSAGRVDMYENFPGADSRESPPRPLVVISLGLREGERDLELPEIAGVLVARIQSVIDDRFKTARTTLATGTPAPAPTRSETTTASRPADQISATPRGARMSTASMAHQAVSGQMPATELPRLQDLLATVQEGQPLTAAGPATNNTPRRSASEVAFPTGPSARS